MEPVPPVGNVGRTPESVTDAMRLQILATEHWGLLATRSMIWNEMFTRAGMFLTTLSAAMVALALVAQATGFDPTFQTVALLILAVVLFLGLATYFRMGDAQFSEVGTVIGMNRIRHAYLEIAPDLEPYFVTSKHDDFKGLLLTSGFVSDIRPRMVLTATGTIVGVINAVLAGTIGALLVSLISEQEPMRWIGGVVIAVIAAFFLLWTVPRSQIRQGMSLLQPRFPTPPDTMP